MSETPPLFLTVPEVAAQLRERLCLANGDEWYCRAVRAAIDGGELNAVVIADWYYIVTASADRWLAAEQWQARSN